MVSAFYYDQGNFMPVQQDALVLEIVAQQRKEAVVLAVCDGIGGLEDGEYASSYVTMRIREWFYDAYLKHIQKKHSKRRIKRDCYSMFYDCNRYLQLYGKQHGIKLGTTMTMALIWHRKYLLFHVGDCRAFLLGKKCRRLTQDDSSGRNALNKCIGSFSWQGIRYKKGVLPKGERLLLCSDGFWRQLAEEELLQSLGGKRELTEEQLEKRLRKLGQAGRQRGEKDNQAAVILL